MEGDSSSSEADNVAPLLLSWGLSSPSIQRFMNEDYTVKLLPFLSEEVINRLLPKAGPRDAFKFHWNAWKKLQTDETEPKKALAPPIHSELPKEPPVSLVTLNKAPKEPTNPSVSSEDVSQERPALVSHTEKPTSSRVILSLEESEPSINELHELLKSTPEGKAILAFFNLKGKLNDQFRDILATRVIYGETKVDLDKRIDSKRFMELATSIVELFPTESKDTWCELSKKKQRKIVNGRLRHKFYNVRRLFLSVGLINKSKVAEELDSDEGLFSESELEDDNILWLKVHDSPWLDVINKWNLSFQIRKEIFARSKSLSGIISDFPALQKPFGHELLIEDFHNQHPELVHLVETRWPKVITYVRTLLQEKNPEFLGGAVEESDTAIVEVLCNWASVFKPRTHRTNVVDRQKIAESKSKGKPKGKGKGKAKEKEEQPTLVWRPSASEVQQSFVIRIDDIGKLKDILVEREKVLFKFGYTLQPFVVLVGPPFKIRQSIIVLDNIIWTCPGPLEAVDYLFKIFFELNCSYPIEARHIWLLIQQGVYNIHAHNDYKDCVGLQSFIASYVKDCKSL